VLFYLFKVLSGLAGSGAMEVGSALSTSYQGKGKFKILKVQKFLTEHSWGVNTHRVSFLFSNKQTCARM